MLAEGPGLQAERARLAAARPEHLQALAACPQARHPFGGAAAAAAVDRYILQLVTLYYFLLCAGGITWWGETSLLPPGRHGMDAQGLVESPRARVDGCPSAVGCVTLPPSAHIAVPVHAGERERGAGGARGHLPQAGPAAALQLRAVRRPHRPAAPRARLAPLRAGCVRRKSSSIVSARCKSRSSRSRSVRARA